MAEVCRVCAHKKTNEIEKDIVQGMAHTQIGRKYGIHFQSVRYHSENHLPKKLVDAVQDENADHAENILSGIRDLLTSTKKILDKAEDRDHNRLALEAIREARSTYELLSKIAVKMEEFRRQDQENEDFGMQEQISEGIQALTTAELKTYIALQTKIYAAQSGHELNPAARYMVESMSRMWDTVRVLDRDEGEGEGEGISSRNSHSNVKNSQNRQSTSPVEKELEFEDLDLDLDDFELDDSDQIPSEKTDPEWLVEWRKENRFK